MITCSSPTGGATPIRGCARTGRRSPSCSVRRPSAVYSSRASCGGHTRTGCSSTRSRTATSPRPSSVRAGRCCWTSGCCSAGRTTSGWSCFVIPRSRTAMSHSSAALICATRGETTSHTAAIRRRCRCRVAMVSARRGMTCSFRCAVPSSERSTPRSASVGRPGHRWISSIRWPGCATGSQAHPNGTHCRSSRPIRHRVDRTRCRCCGLTETP